MKIEAGKLLMARLARITHELAECDARRAELGAQQAAVWSEMAQGETVDLRTLRKARAPHMPEIPEPSEFDRARARIALRDHALRKK